jgi:hypothetical protein
MRRKQVEGIDDFGRQNASGPSFGNSWIEEQQFRLGARFRHEFRRSGACHSRAQSHRLRTTCRGRADGIQVCARRSRWRPRRDVEDNGTRLRRCRRACSFKDRTGLSTEGPTRTRIVCHGSRESSRRQSANARDGRGRKVCRRPSPRGPRERQAVRSPYSQADTFGA